MASLWQLNFPHLHEQAVPLTFAIIPKVSMIDSSLCIKHHKYFYLTDRSNVALNTLNTSSAERWRERKNKKSATAELTPKHSISFISINQIF